MRDAEAWCAAGIVGPGRPLLVTSSALPMMLGLILVLLVQGSIPTAGAAPWGFSPAGPGGVRVRGAGHRDGVPLRLLHPRRARSGVPWHPAHGAALAVTLGGACLAEMGPAQQGDILS